MTEDVNNSYEYDDHDEKAKDENEKKYDYNNSSKEYQNLNGFYLNISYEHENMIIIIYNWKRFYKTDLNWSSLSSSYNDYFKNDKIENGYEKIINLINENNYDIKETKNKIILKLNIKNYKEENKKIKEDLDKLIRKKLSMPKIIEKKKLVLINFDKNSELNIYDKNYGNEIFNTLKNEECDKLKELRLYNINISDISGLKGFRLEKLRKLGLNDNKIKDISILKDIKFESLEELWLSNNTINDITVLEKCNLELLIKLDLSFNVISNINILKRTKLKNLKELFLYKNKIEDIKPLENEDFKNLEKLDLSLNLITDICIFSDEKNIFNKLKYLNLSHNKINDINCLQNISSGGYIFGFFSSSNSPLCNLRDFSLVNNPIDVGKNSRTLNYLQSLYINFRI